jgi:periplasmic protein TorT
MRRKITFVGFVVCLLFVLNLTCVYSDDQKEWWPLEIFSVDNCPKNVGIGEKMASGRVLYSNYTPPQKANSKFTIGVLFPHLKDPYWLGPCYGIANEAKRLGVSLKLLSAGGYDNNVKQINQMEDLVINGVDGIIIVPLSFTAQDKAIEAVAKKGIPVIELLNDVRTDVLVTKVGVSFVQMGYAAGKYITDHAQKAGLKKVYTAYFPGPAGAAWSQFSWEGFKKALDESPIPVENLALKWGEPAKEVQMKLIEDVLLTFGDKLNYISGDAMAAGTAVIPIRAKKLVGKVNIVSVDLSDYVLPWIKNGEILAGTSTQGVDQSRLAMNLLVELLNGDKKANEFPDVIGAKIQILTKENYNEFPMGGIVAPKGFKPIFKVN